MQNWRQAVRTPTSYRVGNSTIRMQTSFVYSVALCGLAVLMLLYLLLPESRHGTRWTNEVFHRKYNDTYPLTTVVKDGNRLVYRVAAVSDLDERSKSGDGTDAWTSYFKRGVLTYDPTTHEVTVKWDDNATVLRSSFGYGGRGMELSELIVFDGRLLAIDDRTGIVFDVSDGQNVVPWVLLVDGNGKRTKGFKGEWMAVKENELYVGGLGKEWTNSRGDFLHSDPQWVKIILPSGSIEHVDWHERYDKLREAAGIRSPGYMIHEAAAWSSVHNKWFFLPRRASRLRYDERSDEHRGTNLVLRCSDDFKDVEVDNAGPLEPTRGFSSFKFIPRSQDKVIVALKSEEIDGQISSYVVAFHVDGTIVMPQTKVGDVKFEGIEFV